MAHPPADRPSGRPDPELLRNPDLEPDPDARAALLDAAAAEARERRKARPAVEILLNALRGLLIGAVETMPGVSGGTVALVVKVYERLIDSATALLGGLVLLTTSLWKDKEHAARGRARLREVEWLLVAPLLAAMLVGAVTMADVMETLLHEHPVMVRAAFFGMVAASLLIPVRLAGTWRLRDVAISVAGAVLAGFAVSLPPQTLEPTPLIIVVTAAVAVCALALPGLSGSFLLLSFGMYEPTLSAVNNRDFGHLAWFFGGAALGGVAIVFFLRWLLHHYHHATMVVVTGLMAGGLRALWPWQDEDRNFVAAGAGEAFPAGILALAGAGIVLLAIWLEARHTAKARAEAEARVLEG
ncbi:DUF368 domain-containing protein [Zafaria sp. Z1313]|uniref:DUF368 domain-containing protein n=1 Tax=unclassified Zafaria TaxID=2828765 RepID=UPI002E798231|nr:DUF368 domain-containing protein [Zafaria sp. J156]MEE1622377.1 DUF368 domain-containing protein [Zafaria sp. J156]